MSRTTRTSMSRKLLWSLLGVIVVCVLLAMTARAQTLHVHVHRATSTRRPALTIVSTQETWFGKPIFAMTNNSSFTLRHVALKSWSYQLLPILAIAKTMPTNWPSKNAGLGVPPYHLPPHETLWFVGPNQSPAHFNLYWIDAKKEPVYEMITAKK